MNTQLATADLSKLADEGNSLAGQVKLLLENDYPATREGYKQAIADSFEAYSSLFVDRFPLKLSSEPDKTSPLGKGVRDLATLAQIYPSQGGIPSTANPLAAALLLGTAGAGLGRLGGTVVGKFTGDEEGRAKRTGTIAGLGAGLAIPAGLMAFNYYSGKNPFGSTKWMFKRASAPVNETLFLKASNVIPVDQLQEMIWNDPNVAHRLPLSITGATSGLVEGAQRLSNQRSGVPFVTPHDVARMAVGMGSGYVSGLLVGKALGSLFGVSEKAQTVLRQSGMAAGVIRSFVPHAFGA